MAFVLDNKGFTLYELHLFQSRFSQNKQQGERPAMKTRMCELCVVEVWKEHEDKTMMQSGCQL